MTRREASEALLALSLPRGKELNGFLLDIQGKVSDEDFNALRRMVASVMGEILTSAITPIVAEFPELRPDGLR